MQLILRKRSIPGEASKFAPANKLPSDHFAFNFKTDFICVLGRLGRKLNGPVSCIAWSLSHTLNGERAPAIDFFVRGYAVYTSHDGVTLPFTRWGNALIRIGHAT